MTTAPAVPSEGPSGAGTRHAVVVGGSMAGLAAARVLAAHVDQVTIIERDRLPDGADHRKGVPQGRQLHVLLARGLGVLERMYPGYGRELEAAGAVRLRVPTDVLMLSPAGWLDRRARGWTALSASRPVIETAVRRRLVELPGVTVLERHEVTALGASGDGRVVRGVTVRSLDGGDTSFVAADLVVDASGRGSRAPSWLTELGFPAPRESQVDPDIAYATRVYRIPDGFAADWKAVMLTSRPPTFPRTGYLFPIEDRQWMLTLMGAAGQHPPTDEAGFTAFVESLRSPVIANAVAGAEPVTEVRAHRGTSNRQWHFERMARWPERFVVLGDAVSAFNPIYGQGMTTAAVAAEALDRCLRTQRRRRPDGDLDGLAPRFQRELARRNADPWGLSTGEDLRFPTTTGTETTAALRLQHRYLDRVVTAATRDPAMSDTYTRVLGMLDRPTALFRPRVLVTALRTRPVSVDRGPAPPASVPAPRTPAEQAEVRA
jgi:2-polyprenyl-6-methoxyphenol hydroxylase-like FAD-dependent oxidoreductase